MASSRKKDRSVHSEAKNMINYVIRQWKEQAAEYFAFTDLPCR
jgi:hypothetical protein